MSKPVLLAVDDDNEVLRAVDRDLKQKYASEYRVLRAESGQVALDTLKQLKLRNETVALMLVDQRMPQMTGVAFLKETLDLYPKSKRVLLTAYADTEAAIQAINGARIDYYLTKPWTPPQESLYPILDDLLDDWRADYKPAFDGVRVVGHRWSPESHAVKDFMARNRVPYQWVDVEAKDRDDATRQLLDALGKIDCLPVVLFPDGTRQTQPTITQVAEKLGLQIRADETFYDLVIVGAGPAGLAAAVYGASEGLKTLMIEREAPGGQAGTSSRIENYLGFPNGISGSDLARRALDQARRFGVEVLSPQEAVKVRVEDSYRIVTLSDGSEVGCHALLLATGVSWRKLDVPGVERLTGAGVYYGAAMSEAMACKDEDVYLIGGANSAGQAAMFFSEHARTVTMLIRGESLAKSMSQYLIDQIEATPNITLMPFTNLVEAKGDTRLECLTLLNSKTGEKTTVPAASLFIFIGAEPMTDWLGDLVERDSKGFILSGPDLIHNGKRPASWTLERDPTLPETSVPGIFVAGDVRCGSVKRCAAGVGAGSTAVQFIHQYLAEVRG
jgi:thioredoxin reductase (NADPH)